MKIVKNKATGEVLSYAEEAEVQTPVAKKLIVRGANLIEVDEYGVERYRIMGNKEGFEIEDYVGELPNDIAEVKYELVDGKLTK